MFALILTLMAAQPAPSPTPPDSGAVVLVVRREGLSAIESSALADRLARALGDAGVPLTLSPDDALAHLGKRNPLGCRRKPTCIAQLGRLLHASAVVAIDAGRIFEDLPARIQVLDTRDGRVLLDRLGTVAADRLRELDDFFRQVSKESLKALSGLPGFAPPSAPETTEPPAGTKSAEVAKSPVPVAPPPSDAPKVVSSPPSVSRLPGPDLVATGAPSPVPRYLAGGGAALAGVAAATFLVLGVMGNNNLHASTPAPEGIQGSPLTFTEANEIAKHARTDFTLAAAFAGVGAALGVVTIALDPAPPPKH